jgi:hypothetical protein
MTTQDFEAPADPSAEGQRRRLAWEAHNRQLDELSRAASMDAHRATSAQLSSGPPTRGYLAMTPDRTWRPA